MGWTSSPWSDRRELPIKLLRFKSNDELALREAVEPPLLFAPSCDLIVSDLLDRLVPFLLEMVAGGLLVAPPPDEIESMLAAVCSCRKFCGTLRPSWFPLKLRKKRTTMH